MRRLLKLLPLLVSSSAACVATEPQATGMETAGCIDGACLGELQCLSDLCVSPEDSQDGSSGGGAGVSSAGTSGPGTSAGGTSAGSGGSSPTDPSDPSDPNPQEETGDPTDDPTTGLPPGACSDVDVLFVVDNSGSMVEEQGRLAAAAPAFVDELVAITGTVDPHVMVINVEPPAHPCDIDCVLFQTCNADPDYVCGAVVEPTTCEEALGAGVGGPTDADDCGFTSGERFIDGTQPNMAVALDCALGVGTGTGSGIELTMQSMVEALDGPAFTRACNEGFLREDALLVVVFVTDEDDDAADSSGNPAGWKVQLVEAKGGEEQSIFVLGLFGDDEAAPSNCQEEAEYSIRLSSFVGLWGSRGMSGSVCAPSYASFFNDLLDSISVACG